MVSTRSNLRRIGRACLPAEQARSGMFRPSQAAASTPSTLHPRSASQRESVPVPQPASSQLAAGQIARLQALCEHGLARFERALSVALFPVARQQSMVGNRCVEAPPASYALALAFALAFALTLGIHLERLRRFEGKRVSALPDMSIRKFWLSRGRGAYPASHNKSGRACRPESPIGKHSDKERKTQESRERRRTSSSASAGVGPGSRRKMAADRHRPASPSNHTRASQLEYSSCLRINLESDSILWWIREFLSFPVLPATTTCSCTSMSAIEAS
jgi:hypothetical protein